MTDSFDETTVRRDGGGRFAKQGHAEAMEGFTSLKAAPTFPPPVKLEASDGFDVHRLEEWPLSALCISPRNSVVRRLRPEAVLHTTQDRVSPDLVERKIAQIESGEFDEREHGSVVVAEGKTWCFDGHHTLTAARKLGVEIRVRVYLAAARSGDIIEPPRYQGPDQ